MVSYDPCQRRFAYTGRSPENHRRNTIFFNQIIQYLPLSYEVLLTDKFIQCFRPHAAGQRLRHIL